MLDERDPLDELVDVRATMEAARERLARTNDGELGQIAARLAQLASELERVERLLEKGALMKVGR